MPGTANDQHSGRRRRVRAAVLAGIGTIVVTVIANVLSSAVETSVLPAAEPPPGQVPQVVPTPGATFGPPTSSLVLSSGVGMPVMLNSDGEAYASTEYLLRNTSDRDVTVSGVKHEGRVCMPGLAQHVVVPAGGTLPLVVSVPGLSSTSAGTVLQVVVDSEVVPVHALDVPDPADELNWQAAESVFAELLVACEPAVGSTSNTPVGPAGS